MSLNRIAKRRAFKASQPSVYAFRAAERLAALGLIARWSKRQTYHEYAIATGDRHPTFQKNVRAVRAEDGLRPTSSDMCRVHGRRVS